MIVLDANTILRCILQDNEDVAALVDEQMTHNVGIALFRRDETRFC